MSLDEVSLLRRRYREVQISFQMTDAVWRSAAELDTHVDRLLEPGGVLDQLSASVVDVNNRRISGGGEAFQPAAELSKAYATPQSRHFRSPALLEAIEGVLERLGVFVYPGCPTPGNWWAWQIGIPMRLGDILLHAGENLPQAVRSRWTETMAYLSPDLLVRPPGPESGANGLWVAFNGFKYGLVTGDARYIEAARSVIAGICRVSPTEGIQHDWSYHFHGPGLNMGYGGDQLFDVSRYIYVTAGSRFQLPPEALATHLAWIRNFILWNMRGSGQNPYSMGRAGTRGDVGHSTVRMHLSAIVYVAASGVEAQLDDMDAGQGLPDGDDMSRGKERSLGKELPLAGYVKDWVARFGAHNLPLEVQPLVEAILEGPAVPWAPRGVRYYPRSDYLAVHRDGYAAWVRMHGKERIGWFSIHNENRRGWYAGDGTFVLMQTGREFHDGVLATQDWERLPGITRVVSDAYKRPQGQLGMSEFVSGATLRDETGLCAMEFRVAPADGGPPLIARKSWTAFPDETIVALGSGIELDADLAVESVVDQRTIDGVDCVYVGDERYAATEGLELHTEAPWIHAGSVGYVFLVPGARVRVEERVGRFTDITAYVPYGTTPEREYRHRTCTLVVEHGVRVRDGGYAVVYLPGAAPGAVAQYAAEPQVQVLRRDAGAHVVRHVSSGTVAAVFFRPEQTPEVGLNTPGTVVYQVKEGNLWLSVACTGDGGDDSGTMRRCTVRLPLTLEAKSVEAAGRAGRTVVATEPASDGGTLLHMEWSGTGHVELQARLGSGASPRGHGGALW